MSSTITRVAAIGVDLRLTHRPEPVAYWRGVTGAPVLAQSTTAIDVAPAVGAALASSGLGADAPGTSRLAVFVSGVAQDRALVGATSIERASGLDGLVRAARAIEDGGCDIAVALAIDDVSSAAVVLQRRELASRPIGLLCAAITHPDAHWNPEDAGNVLLEACAAAAFDPASLTLIDARPGHGERADLMLDRVSHRLARRGPAPPHCAVGPLLPSQTALASLVAVATVVRSLHERRLPPLCGADLPMLSRPFCADRAPRPWIDGVPRRAALWDEAGTDPVALVFEEAPRNEAWPPPPLAGFDPLRVAFLSSDTREALAAACASAATRLRDYPSALESIVAPPAHPPGRCRAAVTGRTSVEIARKLDAAARLAATPTRDFLQTPDGVFFCDINALQGKTALLFPGQGGQYLGMFGDLCLFLRDFQVGFERLRDNYPAGEVCLPGQLVAPATIGLGPTDRAILEQALTSISRGPMVSLVGSVRLQAVLRACGVRVDAVAGYSNGENAALIASGAARIREFEEIFGVARVVRTYDEDFPFARGVSIAVNHPPRDVIAAALAASGNRVFIALDNCPDQLVLFGDAQAMSVVVEKVKAAGGMCVELAFAHGHHTPAYAKTLDLFRGVYRALAFGPADIPIYSCATAAPFPDDEEEVRTLAARQWGECVRFGDTVERMYADGVRYFIEAGPGSTLTGFVRSVLKKRWHVAMASNVAGRSGPDQLHELLARLFVLGHDVTLDPIRDGYLPVESFTIWNTLAEPGPPSVVAAPSVAPAAPAGTADRILMDHLALMNAFLDTQARTYARVAAQLGVAEATPSFPMLGDAREVADGHQVVHRVFRRSADLFLDHHTLRRTRRDGEPIGPGIAVVPFTFSMEVLAEAASALGGWPQGPLTLSNIRGSRWIALDGDTLALDVVAAPADAAGAIAVRIAEASAPAGAAPSFNGLASEGAVEADFVRDAFDGPVPALPAAEFNDKIFHGDRLLSIDRVLTTNAHGLVLEAVIQPVEGLFTGDHDPALRTPAALLDSVSQLPAFWLAEREGLRAFGTFPFELKRYSQYSAPPPPGTRVTMKARVWQTGHIIATTATLYHPSGAPFAHVEDMRMRVMKFPERFYAYVFDHHTGSRLSDAMDGAALSRRMHAFPSEMIDTQGIWVRVLAAVALTPRERAAMYERPIAERMRFVLLRVAAKEIALDIIDSYGARTGAVELETAVDDATVIVRGGALDDLNFEIHVHTAADGTAVVAVLSGCHAAAVVP